MSAGELTLRPQETVDRSSGIGSSEIAAVVGLDPYRSPFDVFIDKTGLAPKVDRDSGPMRWGRILQRPIAEHYEQVTGRTLIHLYDEPMRHPDRPWQIASPDCLCPPERLEVEVKTAGLRQAARYGEGEDEIPEEHLLQVHWQLDVLDYERADVAVLLGGQDFRVYHVARDRELESRLVELAEEFWTKHVLAKVPPEISATERAREYLRYAFPREREELRPATEEEVLLASVLRAARGNLKRMEARCEETENRLKLAIGDAAGIEGPTWRCTWKASKDSTATDWKAIASELEPPEELVTKHTKPKPGSRRFLARFEDDKEQTP